MPIYTWNCESCDRTFEEHRPMAHSGPVECVECHGLAHKVPCIPACIVPGRDLHERNGGRGEYLGQAAKRPDVVEPDLFFKSQNQAIEIAKRKGFDRIEKA